MSLGTDRYTFRLDPVLMAQAEELRLSRNEHTREEPWTLSDYVRVAIAEKNAKMRRSRRKYPKRKNTVGTVWG